MQIGSFGINHLELILLLLLTLVMVLAVIARRIQIPYPIVMVIGGLLLSFLPHVPHVSLDPDVVFLIFLPPLLFSASFQISWRDFRNNLVSIVLLAFGLVGFTVYGVALTTKSILPGFDWRLGLVLGAVVATTDAIAATATAKRLGLPRGITDLLEAESLVNDGSGLLALKFTAAIVVTGVTPSFAVGVGELLYLISIAVVVGLLIGVVAKFLLQRIDDAPVEITLTVVVPYVTYLAAEAIHCSGVLATIACGLYLGRHSSAFFSLHARIEARAFWNTVDFVLNGLVFLLLGLQLPGILADIHGMSAATLILDGIAFSSIVILLRLLWAFPGAWLSVQVRRHVLRKKDVAFSKRRLFLVGWAGMRGVLALTAAISLPTTLQDGTPFPQRSLIIFLTFCVIFATLVLQGLTMPVLIRRLGLAGSSENKSEVDWARGQMVEAALRYLDGVRRSDTAPRDAVAALQGYYRRELEMMGGEAAEDQDVAGSVPDARRRLGRESRAVEREVVLSLRQQDKIHDDVLRILERELDLLDARFAKGDS